MFKLLKRKALEISQKSFFKLFCTSVILTVISFTIYSLNTKEVTKTNEQIATEMYNSAHGVIVLTLAKSNSEELFLKRYYAFGQEVMEAGKADITNKALKAVQSYKKAKDTVGISDFASLSISDNLVSDEDIAKFEETLNLYKANAKVNQLKDLVNVFNDQQKATVLTSMLPKADEFESDPNFFSPEEIYDAKHSKMYIIEAIVEFVFFFAVIFGFFAIIKVLMKKSVEKFETLKTDLEEALHSAKEIANEIIFATFKMTFVALNEAKDTVATQKVLNQKAIEDRKELREKLDNGELELDADEIQVKLDEADKAVIASQEKLVEAMNLVSKFELELAEEKLELDEKYKSQTVPLETTRESAEQEIQEYKVKLEKACDELINASDKYRENFSRFYKKDDALLVSTKEFLAVYREDLNEQPSTDEVKQSALTKLFAAISSKLEARDAKKAEKKAKA